MKNTNKQEPKTKIVSEKEIYNAAKKYRLETQYNACIEEYNKLLKISPNNMTYLQELGVIYIELNLLDNALECFTKIYNKNPFDGVNLNNLGICNHKKGNYVAAIDWFKKILHIKNDIPDVYKNISVCYIALKKYKLAETTLQIVLKLRQDDDVYESIANLYFYMKKYDESILFYKKIKNKTPKILYNLCFPYLAKKNFSKGLSLYEKRLEFNEILAQTNAKQRVELPQIPNWDGKSKCDSLLVVYEQGIGDNILYFRFIIELSKKYPDMKITYFCTSTFRNFFKGYDNIIVKTDKEGLDILEYNFKVFIMSLPYFLKIDKIIPNKENYIIENVDKLDYWTKELEPLKKIKVGFVYNGLLMSFIEKFIPLIEFVNLTKLDIDLICICKKNEYQSDKESLSNNNSNKNVNNNLENVHFYDIDRDAPFQDTIAILKNIDLLITIDTAIVHLAGVLNVKTWLLLGYGSDWRWFNDANKIDWFDSIELMRMEENIDLKHIMVSVEKKLSQLLIQTNDK